MLDLTSLLARQGFLPHGYCFTWSPTLVWPMVVSDALIALSYFSIPLAILTFMRKRPMPRYRGVAALFVAFIFVCGVTHVMDVWTIWRPDYGWQLLVKMATAVLSLVTAVALWPLIPRAMRIPSVELLEQTVSDLQSEVDRRVSA
ncbi:MAG TPA: hypothetical protein VFM33_10825, partial [Aquabacterium sp.]|nr:hypothetical protein [Aquabacterium sp.]